MKMSQLRNMLNFVDSQIELLADLNQQILANAEKYHKEVCVNTNKDIDCEKMFREAFLMIFEKRVEARGRKVKETIKKSQ